MDKTVTLALILLAAAITTGRGQAPLPRPPSPDIVIYNAKVITVDPSFFVAEAVAIAGDRFMAVGTSDQMRAIAGPATRLIDLKGQTVIPGLMDNHLHGAGGGPGVDLSRTRSLDEIASALATRVKVSKPGDVIVSNSHWHEAQLREQRLPLRDDLDQTTTEPSGGRITRYPDGRLNGELVDTAKALVRLPAQPQRTRDQQIADRVADYKKLHEVGLTTVRHPGISIAEYRLLQDMRKRGLLTMRINVLLRLATGPAGCGALDR